MGILSRKKRSLRDDSAIALAIQCLDKRGEDSLEGRVFIVTVRLGHCDCEKNAIRRSEFQLLMYSLHRVEAGGKSLDCHGMIY